jgi:hypothetical protein
MSKKQAHIYLQQLTQTQNTLELEIVLAQLNIKEAKLSLKQIEENIRYIKRILKNEKK